MTYELLVDILTLIGLICGVGASIIKLNAAITTLQVTIEALRDTVNDLKTQITTHGSAIGDLRAVQADHEARIAALEK